MVETPAHPGGLRNKVIDDRQAESNLVTLQVPQIR
jgi:hypothetical protein